MSNDAVEYVTTPEADEKRRPGFTALTDKVAREHPKWAMAAVRAHAKVLYTSPKTEKNGRIVDNPDYRGGKAKPIPISAAERIAKDYGYEQVVIYARRHSNNAVEHMTTYGIDKDNCTAAGTMGAALQKFMGWKV